MFMSWENSASLNLQSQNFKVVPYRWFHQFLYLEMQSLHPFDVTQDQNELQVPL